jgi:NADH-quinone oxidoreductase subunit G
MSSNGQQKSEELVTLTIDDESVTVPKGTNLIEAARQGGTEVPYYCYHPHLSVPGNCRMCQVEVEGAPKLMIGCHTQAQPDMVVRTQKTSQQVKDAQASTLELILINHPLDCTVCDQAGHCKLQDYHYEYNAKPSRFLEEKEQKVKAKPLGPTVMLDGERCIACTRCIRFCDEITETSELGLVNRGDKVEITVHPDHELNNPLSGTVVDLCPVGALTHRQWRFNTRIWYTKGTDSICPGCSTGCNVKVFERDGQVVQVKARQNADVNKEWLCDEGRYGFDRFLPQERVLTPLIGEQPVDLDSALTEAQKIKGDAVAVLVSPHLLLEEYALLSKFIEKHIPEATVALAYKERSLSKEEAILVSPDYAPNFSGALFSGLITNGDSLEQEYQKVVDDLKAGNFKRVMLVGDGALDDKALADLELQRAISDAEASVACVTDGASRLSAIAKVVLPARSVLEKQGLMVNRKNRLQFSDRVVEFPDGTHPEWRLINMLAEKCGGGVTKAQSDRDLTREYLGEEGRLKGLRIAHVKGQGVSLSTYSPEQQESSAVEAQPSA